MSTIALLPHAPLGSWRHRIALLVLAAIIGLNLFAGAAIYGAGDADASVRTATTRTAEVAPPPVEPLRFRQVAPTDALAINAAVPLDAGPNPAASAFKFRGDEADRARALDCLTSAIYYEAATEPVEGQRAVAQVVLNRVRHPAYPSTVCGVVYQGAERVTGCQFTFTCDGSLRRPPMQSYWQRARRIADEALSGAVYAPAGWATHYHTNWVVPYWSSSLAKAAVIGTHIFYRWSGGWGRGPAFTSRHGPAEPIINLAELKSAAASKLAEQSVAAQLDAAAKEAALDAVAANSSVDSFNRAILRRYEPATREGVATVLAKQSRNADAIAASYRWALTGSGLGTEGTPLGQKPAAATAAPTPPACLEGVKKAGEAGEAAKPVGC